MDLILSLRQTAHKFPAAPAIIDGNVRMNWHEYEQETRGLAAGIAELGVRPGERVAILALNSYRYAVFYHAVLRMGGIVVPQNTRFSAAEHVYTLNDSGTVLLVVDNAFHQLAASIAPQLHSVQHYIFAGNETCPPAMQAYQALLDAGKHATAYEDFQPGEDDVFGLFYTGGTTGNPKGVMLTHKNMMVNNMQGHIAAPLPTPLNHLHVAPMFHLADACFFFGVTLLGGCHTFLPTFHPVSVLETIQREHVTHTLLVPTMLQMLIQTPTIQDFDLSTLKRLSYGASPMPSEVLKKAMSIFSGQLIHVYGMTEASPALAALPWEATLQARQAAPFSPEARRLSSVGLPIVGSEVRIVGEDGQDVAVGEIGEIIVRGPNVMKGYWNQAEETAYGLRDGWLYTGDLATHDEHFFIYIVDRKKDMIITGGENVYPTEVENALYSHPAVLEAAVIGLPDPTWGERVHALIVLKPGQQATIEELIAACRASIAGYKVPRSVEFKATLPKSGAGKILKRILRQQIAAQ